MSNPAQGSAASAVAIPEYLARVYWWAYVHPAAVRLFEREWLVNLILWGNFGRLRDAAIDALGPMQGRSLQIACVYGDLTARLLRKIPDGGTLDVVDVLPVQLQNLARKLPPAPRSASPGATARSLGSIPAATTRRCSFSCCTSSPAR